MEKSSKRVQEYLQTHCSEPIFGLWCAPLFPPAASKGSAKVVQGHDIEEHSPKSPKSLVHPLHRALLSALDKLEKQTCKNDSLRRENTRLTLRDSSTEALEEMTNLYTKAQTEKEEMEARIKNMEEAFQEEKKAWQEENRQQLGNKKGFRLELLFARSHIHQMEEEMTELRKRIQEGETQAERETTSVRESLSVQREEDTTTKDHWRELEEKWQRRVSQLEVELQENRSLVSSLIDKMMILKEEHRDTMTLLSQKQSELCQREREWESKYEALEESYRKTLVEKEESWQEKVQAMERKKDMEKMWLQKEEQWGQRTRALEEEIEQLTEQSTQLQGCTGERKKLKQWCKRHLSLKRGHNRGSISGETSSLLPESNET